MDKKSRENFNRMKSISTSEDLVCSVCGVLLNKESKEWRNYFNHPFMAENMDNNWYHSCPTKPGEEIGCKVMGKAIPAREYKPNKIEE